jgi:hypothetical protein
VAEIRRREIASPPPRPVSGRAVCVPVGFAARHLRPGRFCGGRATLFPDKLCRNPMLRVARSLDQPADDPFRPKRELCARESRVHNPAMALAWNNPVGQVPRSYVCSYCNHRVGPLLGWQTNNINPAAFIYLCSYCGAPTYFDTKGDQHPGAPFGNAVASTPKDVAALYAEARSCMTVNSFTSAVLTCRKLLMHIAVEKGAEPSKTFLEYVEYLAQKGYVPPDGKGWVDYIRTKGNEANHEIKIMPTEDASNLITFSEMLLKFVYEFPAKVQPKPPV